MTKTKKIIIRILSLTMTVCMAAGLFVRQKPSFTQAGVNEDSLINKIDADIYNDISGLLDDNQVSRLPAAVNDNQDISVIVAMSTTAVVDAYAQSAKDKSVAEFIGNGDGSRFIAAADRERTSLIRMLDASGINYRLGERYDNVLSGFEITVKAKDFYKTEKLLKDRNATAIVGEVYLPMETKPVYNNPEIDEDTGIFENTIKEITKKDGSTVKADGSGVVVAVLDTGLDYTHSAFDEERFNSDTLVLTEERITNKLGMLESAKTTKNLKAADVYMSRKVPYAYDYADKDTDVLPINSEHGTHVAGIIAGSDDTITGVAPNAQLAIMKVFSDEIDGAKTSWLIAALEDCVALGVDVINMSLGSGCGFTRQEDKKNVEDIYDKVYEAGISLIASAANSYNSTMGSKKNGNNPLTTNPDSGTVGSPSTYKAALSIASVDGVKTSFLKFGDEIMYFTEASTSDAEKKKDFVTDILKTVGSPESYDFEFVYVPGVGKAEEYQEDVTGKIVLIERGDITFEQKVQVALIKKKAAGIIIFNNVSGNISMSVGDDVGAVCSLARDEGKILAKQKRGIITVSQSNKAGPFMSDFSSWGPTSDLKIKPEITAHGGEIKSAVPGQKYEKLSGTSMAAPNQAGATALVRQYVKYSGNFGNYEAGELNDKDVTAIVNRLMMSTADILLNKNGLAYAIRKQGAGLTSLSKSVKTSSYILTYEKENLEGLGNKSTAQLKALAMDKSKLELGDDKERTGVYKMTFGIDNFKSNSITYDIGSIALTEGVNKEFTSHGDATVTMNGYELYGGVTVNSVKGGTQNGNKVTVAGNSVALVTVTLTLTDEDKAYLEQTYKEDELVFRYGMYVEGFITLKAASENEVSLNVPFLTYYGDWEEAPIFDNEYYDTHKDEINLGLNDEDKLMADAYATRITGGLYSDYIATMGTYYFKQSNSSTKIAANKEHIALSNQIAKDNKSNWSISSIRSVSAGLLRNAKRIKITATEDVTGRVIYESEIVNKIKSFSSGGNIFGSSIDIDFINEKGEKVAFNAVDFNLKNNTRYNFVIEAFIDYGSEEHQSEHNARNKFEFSVYVDFEAPIVTNVTYRSEYNEDKKKNRLFADIAVYDNHYSMGVQIGEVVDAKPESGYSFAMQSFGNYVTPVYSSFNSTSTVSVELTDYIDEIKNAKGFMLPNGEVGTVKQNTNSFIATCYDYAMNSASYEIRIPDEVLSVYYNNKEINSDGNLYLSPNETQSLTDLVKVYPYTAWGEVLDYKMEYYKYVPGEEGADGTWTTSSADSYAKIANGKVVALKSTELADDDEHRAYILLTPKGVTGSSAVFPSLKIYVYSQGEKGFRKITPSSVAKFGIEGYKTVYAHYNMDSEDRDIGFTDSVSELEKDRYGNQQAIKMYPYEKIQLDVAAEIYFEDLFRVNFKSSRPNNAKVDSNGVITALQKGKATISAIIEKRSSVDSDDWKAVSGIMSTVEIEVKDPNKIQAIYLMGYKGAGKATNGEFDYVVEIPGNKGITTIYDYAFSGYRYVEKDLDNGDVVTEEDPYYIKQQQIGNDYIKKVIIPEGVTTINKYAFAYLTALEEVVFPSTLTKIGVGAFLGCNNLERITFSGENNLQFINKDAFRMEKVAKGSTVKYYFDEDKETWAELSESKLKFFDYAKREDKNNKYLLGEDMVAIGNNAFENTSLQGVKLAKTCQSVGIGAFKGCSYLGTVAFDSDEMKIGKNAFQGCSNLTNIELNAKVVSASVCEGLTNLTSLTLGKDVKVINEKAFAGCEKLKTIKINKNNAYFKTDLDGKAIYTQSNDGKELVFVAPGADFTDKKLTLPDDYKSIARGALSAVNQTGKIEKVVANGVNYIDDYAFAGSNVTSVQTAPLTYIGEHAFDGSMIKTVCDLEDQATIGAYAFYNTQIKDIELNNSELNIGDYAFANCAKLKTVKLGNNAVIGNFAFACELFPAYENYMHGTQNELYEKGLFVYCYTKYADSDYNYYYDYRKTNRSALTEITLGNDTKVGDNAFAGNVYLQNVLLGSNTVLGDRSFYNNPSLTTVNLENASAIGEYAFSGDRLFSYYYRVYSNGIAMEKLIEYTTVAGEERIKDYAYVSLASAISTANLNAVSVGKGAFNDCVSLTSVTTAKPLTVVNDYAFANTKITEFDLSEATQVGDYAFSNTAIAQADMPKALYIGKYAFSSTPLTKVTFAESYENDKLLNTVAVGEGAFMYCESLDDANLEVLSNIGAKAFMNTAFTSVKLTETTALGDYAFGESKVNSVAFGENLATIGNNPFYGCQISVFGKLEENKDFGITVLNDNCRLSDTIFVENGVIYEDIGNKRYQLIAYPEKATAIEYTVKAGTVRIAAKAFYNAPLVNVTLSSELKAIGDKAFYGCDNLATIVFTSLSAPALEEEYDEFYFAKGDNIPFKTSSGGLNVSKYYMWNAGSRLNNLYYGANFVNYVGKVDKNLTMVCPANGINYDEFIYRKYFNTLVRGSYAATEQTIKVIAMIDALPERIALEDEDAVVAAREAYNDLGLTSQQYLVTNYEKLTKAESLIKYHKMQDSSFDEDDSSVTEQKTIPVAVWIVIPCVLVLGAAAVLYFTVIRRKIGSSVQAEDVVDEESDDENNN